jgi:hypothetical protein
MFMPTKRSVDPSAAATCLRAKTLTDGECCQYNSLDSAGMFLSWAASTARKIFMSARPVIKPLQQTTDSRPALWKTPLLSVRIFRGCHFQLNVQGILYTYRPDRPFEPCGSTLQERRRLAKPSASYHQPASRLRFFSTSFFGSFSRDSFVVRLDMGAQAPRSAVPKSLSVSQSLSALPSTLLFLANGWLLSTFQGSSLPTDVSSDTYLV